MSEKRSGAKGKCSGVEESCVAVERKGPYWFRAGIYRGGGAAGLIVSSGHQHTSLRAFSSVLQCKTCFRRLDN
jgi:hypothetical protein